MTLPVAADFEELPLSPILEMVSLGVAVEFEEVAPPPTADRVEEAGLESLEERRVGGTLCFRTGKFGSLDVPADPVAAD